MNGLVGRVGDGHGDLAALYEELAKLHHPACPDIDWRQVEQWCRELLRDNGSDLQIAAFLALALAQRYGLPGLAEGLKVMVQMLSGAWDRLWPRNATERMDILAWLFVQLQPLLRGLGAGERDAATVRGLESDLETLQALLRQHRLPTMTAMHAFIRQVELLATRLDDVPMPATKGAREPESNAAEPPLRVFVSVPEAGSVAPRVYVERLPAGASRGRGLRFALWGALAGMILALSGVLGWHLWQRFGQEPPIVVAPVRLDSLQLFGSGSAELKPESTKLLINALASMKAQPGWRIVITGHSDATGDESRNLALARARAEAVRDWMKAMGDVPEDCFAVHGQGSSRPVADNASEAGRAANRRVDISLVPEPGACQAHR